MSLSDRYDRVRKAHHDSNKPKPTLRQRGGRVGRFVLRVLKGSVVVALGLGIAGAGWFGWFYKNEIVENPGPHLERAAIEEIIAQESPILYRDASTRLGVFFAREHREYVGKDRIPQAWKDAIVASEDQRFYEHPGVDPKGIARAMKQNVEAGRLVAGGSSLTQQTAKNLYYRPDRSLQSKWRELVNALRLEAHYGKDDILEFYANQFHVSANGRGIGIAARYFFDKEVEALTTLECAFIAGMVKAPAAYNPFVGATEERRDRARAKARARTRYVLDRMRATGSISQAEHARLVEQEIPFKKGEFRYASSILVDEVADRLAQAPFPELFEELGIDNPSTSGIQVVTTLDEAVQRDATYALWHHLTEVGGVLEGLTAAGLRLPESAAPHKDPDNPPGLRDFSAATVLGPTEAGVGLRLDLGGTPCVVDEAGLTRMAAVIKQAEKGEPWKKARRSDATALATALPAGAVVWASVGEAGRCDLERRPELQGGLLVLDQGQVRAMVGGNDNRDFNRAVDARRQLGSTWKPLVYHAALQLGWAPTDALDNREGVFVFEGTWYYPRADHTPDDTVSLAWAGTRSENLASIWLLAHLLDRLDRGELQDVAGLVGLTPRKGEERGAWIRRVRDDWGVISVPSRYPELAFVAARQDLLLRGELTEPEALELMSLHYGRGVDAEVARVLRNDRGGTRARKLAALDATFLGLAELSERCTPQVETLRAFIAQTQEAAEEPGLFGRIFSAEPEPVVPPAVAAVADVRVRFTGGGVALACGDQREPGWLALDAAVLEGLAASPPTDPVADAVDPVLGGRVRASVIDEVSRGAQRRLLVLEGGDAYDLEVLQYHPDFRALLAMRYLATQARALGVQSDLPPVLSLPLGAVDLGLEEAAAVYQGMLSGSAWTFGGEQPGALAGIGARSVPAAEGPTLLIAEIRDRNGEVLYRATPEAVPVADPDAGLLVADVLRNVVDWGTGRRARGAVQLAGTAVPVGGKTGTTNGYRNAAFLGFVPRATEAGWRPDQGVVIASYVGYDDNRPMRRGGLRLAGASGALPPWIGAAQAVVDAGLVGTAPPAADAVGVPEGHARVPVLEQGGLPAPAGEDTGGRTVLVRGAGLDGDGTVSAERRVAPAPRGGARVPISDAPVAGPAEEPSTAAEPEDAAALDEVWLEEAWGEAPPGASGDSPQGLPGGAPDAVPDDPPEPDTDLDIDPRIVPE